MPTRSQATESWVGAQDRRGARSRQPAQPLAAGSGPRGRPAPRLGEPAAQPAPQARAPAAQPAPQEHILAELLIEDVSIDGMCGVY
jgi:mycofactocin precursor